MTSDEKTAIDADLASMLEYHTTHTPRQYSEDSEGDGNTGSNLLFFLAMLVLIAGPIVAVMMFGGG